MNRVLLFCILMLLPFGGLIHAKIGDFTILNRRKAVFENTQCEVTASCSLKRVQYLTEGFQVGVDAGYNYGTRLFAWYETDSLETLEDYAFVQFIKGCMYYSTRIKDGRVGIMHYISRSFFDDTTIFKHPKWVIDSQVSDPVDGKEGARHYFYRWNKVPNSILRETEVLYGLQQPPFPKLYLTDRSGTAFFSNGSAKNVSLQFLLCIYKTKDIPVTTTPDNTKFAEPLHCFFWENSFIYNHEKGEFDWSAEIAPACLE